MRDESGVGVVVDASVAAKLYFNEEGSDAARRTLQSGVVLLAPDLLFVEIASVAAKRVRRGLSTLADATIAVASVRELIDTTVSVAELADRAFELAWEHGFSVYDATYLSLAEASGAKVLTADAKLVRRASEVGFLHLVQSLVF